MDSLGRVSQTTSIPAGSLPVDVVVVVVVVAVVSFFLNIYLVVDYHSIHSGASSVFPRRMRIASAVDSRQETRLKRPVNFSVNSRSQFLTPPSSFPRNEFNLKQSPDNRR